MSREEVIRILLIEDNPGDAIITETAFEEIGMNAEVSVAPDGIIGLRYLNKQAEFKEAITPDLILLDINMPEMNGKEVLKTIKEDKNLKTIPVIMLTSSEAEVDILSSYDSHANSYIVKPVTIDRFIDVAKSIQKFWMDTTKLPGSTKRSQQVN